MRFPRCSGVLLHPTSLPGPHGIGELGEHALAFVDFLAEAGQSLWQVLPLGPTGYGDSPYQCFSAFAGSPLLVSLEALRAEGLLEADDFAGEPAFADGKVDFGVLIPWKRALLERAAARFAGRASASAREEHRAWCARHADWLEDFALFMAIKDAHGGREWTAWPAPLRHREPAALTAARGEHAAAIATQRFVQWTFARQWSAVREYAHERGVTIMGDTPIFVAFDSADVWARPELFQLDASGLPTAVAGVPPDYFAKKGQLWGNPLYRWEAHAADGFAWWIARVRTLMEQVDRLRLDHFIGFTRYWAVPYGNANAVDGAFRPGPGQALFDALAAALGDLPIVAEDLGLLIPEVEALRDRFELPGMKILQFAFGGEINSTFLPHAFRPNCVVYTGTHDNDTTLGWWQSAKPAEREHLARYLGRDVHDPAWDLVRLALASVADTALVPAQDLLALETDARMNLPGRAADNWQWRLRPGQFDANVAARLRELATLYGRLAPA